MLIGVIVLTAAMMVFAFATETAVTASSVIVYMVMIVFLIVAYIGGNVFHSFVTSKFFVKDKEDEEK